MSAKNFHHIGFTPCKTPIGTKDIYDNNSILASIGKPIKIREKDNFSLLQESKLSFYGANKNLKKL